MKYRYVVTREDEGQKFVITELSRRSDDAMDPTGKAEFSRDVLEAAAADGIEALLAVVRTDKMYPPTSVAMDLASCVQEMLKAKTEEAIEGIVDEIDVEPVERKPPDPPPKSEDLEESEDDEDDDFEDKDLLEDDDVAEPITKVRVQEEADGEDVPDAE